MAYPNLNKIYEEALNLRDSDKLSLISKLVSSIQVKEKPKKRSLLELKGLGKEVWQNINVDEYINDLRNEWDERI